MLQLSNTDKHTRNTEKTNTLTRTDTHDQRYTQQKHTTKQILNTCIYQEKIAKKTST